MLADINQQGNPQVGSSCKHRRIIKLPRYSKLNRKLVRELDNLLEYVWPEHFERNLRNLFLSHLDYEKDHPLYFEDLIIGLHFLF